MTQKYRGRVDDDNGCRWQGAGEHEWSARVVLHCVLARCAARELWRCGAVCRAWRLAAADAQLWRRLLLPHARPEALAALADLNDSSRSHDERETGGWWRAQYALSAARWRRLYRLASSADGAAPAAAALHRVAPLLALLRDDGQVTVWSVATTENETADPALWQKRWEGGTRGEWRYGTDARWAPHARRLLVAGKLTLADRFEVIIYDFDDVDHGVVSCRAAAAGGVAGCWVDDATFLTLELRLLAPRQGCTTLWLNAATQKTQSEHAGVTSPLLRIYNESAATISDVAVVELSREVETENESEAGAGTGVDVELGGREPDVAYYRALAATQHRRSVSIGPRVLIAAGGAPGGARGCGQALLLWRLSRPLVPPPLLVQDGLAERMRRWRERPSPPPPPREPDEAEVRALCTPPDALCRLPSQVLGFVVHPNGRCVWIHCAAGTACASLPALRPLLWLPCTPSPTSLSAPSPPLVHRVLPAVDDDLFITPVGGGSAVAVAWLVRGGVVGSALQADASVLSSLLLPRRRRTPLSLALLTADALEVLAGVCPVHADAGNDGSVCRPPPCGAPAARPLPPPTRHTCTPPPPTGHPPPCPPPAPPQTLTCEDAMTKTETEDRSLCQRAGGVPRQGRCGLQLDAVARQLAAAEHARREHYEHEAGAAVREPTPPTDFSRYCLAAARDADLPPACPTNTEHCQIYRHKYADFCAQYPRKEVHLDRGPVIHGSKGFAARIMEKLRSVNSAAGQAPACPESHPPLADRCSPRATSRSTHGSSAPLAPRS